MRGITEEKLKKIRDSGEMHGTTMWRITECFIEELNPWHPIESAPKDGNILYLYPETNGDIKEDLLITTEPPGCRSVDYRYATHWMKIPELPEPPK